MLLGINVKEKDLLKMTDAEKIALVDSAYFRTKQMQIRAKAYEQRLVILPRKPEEVLDQKEFMFVQALWKGLFD